MVRNSRRTRRTVLTTIGTGTAALLGAGAATAQRGASGDDTIVDIAAGDDRFDTLVTALRQTGLDAVLASDDDQFTVFAPTDAAFAGVDTSGLTDEQLTDVLLYHVTEGRRYAGSVVNAPELEILNGDTVSVDGTTLNDGQADVVATNIEASNGVIHVIDGVLLP